MSLLSDEEIMVINQTAEFDSAIGYARKIESAIMERLKAQEHACEAIDVRGAACRWWWSDYGLSLPKGTKLYTHPIPADDVVRDAELEAMLREAREALVPHMKYVDGTKILNHAAQVVAKIDEVLNGTQQI